MTNSKYNCYIILTMSVDTLPEQAGIVGLSAPEATVCDQQTGACVTDFGLLYEQHVGNVVNILARRTDPATAEDIAHDAFVKAMLHMDRFDERDGKGSFAGWLTTIALNCLKDWRRKQGRRPETLVPYLPESIVHHDSMEEGVTTRLYNEHVLGKIPAHMRDTLVSTALHGYSAREFAEEKGISQATVNTRIHRARKVLREIVETEELLNK